MAARISRVAKYYLYVATQAAWFTTPIWNVFLLSQDLNFTQLGVLNSAWWAATVLGEVPTGYVADRIGRRNSLVVGATTHVVCVLVFGLLSTFWAILGVYTVWGIGSTFRSGSDSAWLYDTLSDSADEAQFTHIKGRGTALALAVPAFAFPAFVLRRVVLDATGVFRSTYVNNHAGTLGRATVLSAVAMVLGVARIPVRIGVGALADASAPLVAIGGVGAMLLALGATLYVRRPSASTSPAGAD
jgi:MFS family permease